MLMTVFIYIHVSVIRDKKEIFSTKNRDITLFLITRQLLFSETLCLISQQRNRFRLHMLLQILQKR